MASTAVNYTSVNFLRWAALGVGVWYGYSRQESLTHFVKARKEANEKAEHDALVQEARTAYETAGNKFLGDLALKDGVYSDVEHYKFDAQKWVDWTLNYFEKSSGKN
ncbi:uncharacterized protein BJ171DRAFT_485443 [Polychytrium aggregatum]|uniref:uncharacterized protein n=1 Tax=Polychytrium aggregatum TaxID=110093 RepID=UPI0022FE938E|nr:uncharacterized protein BJ171DRAFT_485443 [Polychytrium aggregatum]KAI9209880.1 hypothetical protein BJ171DRAFT_485443 [Polychytrium aggregatum]